MIKITCDYCGCDIDYRNNPDYPSFYIPFPPYPSCGTEPNSTMEKFLEKPRVTRIDSIVVKDPDGGLRRLDICQLCKYDLYNLITKNVNKEDE